MAPPRKLRHLNVSLTIQRRRRHSRPAYGRILRVRGLLRVVAEESLAGDPSPRHVFHLCGEVGARVDGAAFAVGVWDLLHLDLVQADLDAHAGAALRVFDEDECARLAARQLAEEVFIAGALVVVFVVVVGVVHLAGSRDGRVSSKSAKVAVTEEGRHPWATGTSADGRWEDIRVVEDLRRSNIGSRERCGWQTASGINRTPRTGIVGAYRMERGRRN